MTIDKAPQQNSNFYLNKLNEIRKIIINKKADDKDDKLAKIQ